MSIKNLNSEVRVLMNVTIVGGGNVGTQFAVHCSSTGNEVTIYTSKPEKFKK